ncbi:MAG: ABC-ATPase domain-containing protein [Planctomycetota bacterium]|nr:ABC-ATPase domain-containing protein [Planctomycetota bacterium]MDW8372562.1 ABC-ATPase domain-containing protein [Planctomycetota bacterium]
MLPEPIAPVPGEDLRPGEELLAALARIDGWGPRGWQELLGAWRFPAVDLALEEREREPLAAGGRLLLGVVWRAPRWARPEDAGDAVAIADWLLRQAHAALLPRLGVAASTIDPGDAVRATNAAFFHGRDLCLRLLLQPPQSGLGIDSERAAAALGQLLRWARHLPRQRAALAAHRQSLRVQRALRAALPARGLVAFLADGARLARAADGGPDPGCQPLRAPEELAVTIDLGPLGSFRGLGIRQGITAIAGAAFHGKSTLLAAILAGTEDRPPGDGRERVVSLPETLPVTADDGRPIHCQDLSAFFPALPQQDARRVCTARASGATSMAAAILQGAAAGARVLLLDEDTAAANFLALPPAMRRLLGSDAQGLTLAEALPALKQAGLSTIAVVGACTALLAVADRVIGMHDFQPQDWTERARALAGGRPGRAAPLVVPARCLCAAPDALLGPGHVLPVAVEDPTLPRLRQRRLDLRRCGWTLTPALTRGALLGAAWCCRLAGGQCTLAELAARYRERLAAGGPAALDPFHDDFHAVAPWLLVHAVLERWPEPLCGEPTPPPAPESPARDRSPRGSHPRSAGPRAR